MSSFKQLSKADVTSVSYAANKQWTLPFACPSISNDYFNVYKGTYITGTFSPSNPSIDPITNDQYERLVYDSINHLFYQSYSGSILDTGSLMFNINTYQSASQQRPTGSYFDYNINPLLVKNFPTGANAGIRVLSINQDVYGSKVLPNSFNLSSSAYNIFDDGYGNLYGSGSVHVGNIFYAQGLAIITNPDYQDMWPLPPLAYNDTATYLTSNSSVKTIDVLANDISRSCAIDTGSIVLSGSNAAYYTVNSNGTITLNTSASGNYDVYYTVDSICGNGCTLTSNKAKVTVNVVAVNPPPCITVEFYGGKPDQTFYYVECGTTVTSSLTLNDTDSPVQKCIDGGFGVSGSANYSYISDCVPPSTPPGCSLYLLCGADRRPNAIFYYTTCSGAPVTESLGSTGGACGVDDGVYRCISGSVTIDPSTPWGSYSLVSLNCGSIPTTTTTTSTTTTTTTSPTTTTTTSTTTTTTTSPTTTTSTTSTTTTAGCVEEVSFDVTTGGDVSVTNCCGVTTTNTYSVGSYTLSADCYLVNSVTAVSAVITNVLYTLPSCNCTTTTTTSTTTTTTTAPTYYYYTATPYLNCVQNGAPGGTILRSTNGSLSGWVCASGIQHELVGTTSGPSYGYDVDGDISYIDCASLPC